MKSSEELSSPVVAQQPPVTVEAGANFGLQLGGPAAAGPPGGFDYLL